MTQSLFSNIPRGSVPDFVTREETFGIEFCLHCVRFVRLFLDGRCSQCKRYPDAGRSPK
jgi:hypothetical protein